MMLRGFLLCFFVLLVSANPPPMQEKPSLLSRCVSFICGGQKPLPKYKARSYNSREEPGRRMILHTTKAHDGHELQLLADPNVKLTKRQGAYGTQYLMFNDAKLKGSSTFRWPAQDPDERKKGGSTLIHYDPRNLDLQTHSLEDKTLMMRLREKPIAPVEMNSERTVVGHGLTGPRVARVPKNITPIDTHLPSLDTVVENRFSPLRKT